MSSHASTVKAGIPGKSSGVGLERNAQVGIELSLKMIGGSSPFEFAGAASRCSLVHTATGSVRGWAERLPVIWDDRFACNSQSVSVTIITPLM